MTIPKKKGCGDLEWRLSDAARRLLCGWISLAGAFGCLLLGALAGLLTPWLLLLAGGCEAATAALALWYPKRYVQAFHGRLDQHAVRTQSGVL